LDLGWCPNTEEGASGHFGERLENFLEHLPYSGLSVNDRAAVDARCAMLLNGVDFCGAAASLVACTPGGGGDRNIDKGGWKQLCRALREIDAPHTLGGRVDIATGHYGVLQPDFVAQMAATLRSGGRMDGAAVLTLGNAPTEEDKERARWDVIDDGRTFLYHPSKQTVHGVRF
jgi:hypothetical protein